MEGVKEKGRKCMTKKMYSTKRKGTKTKKIGMDSKKIPTEDDARVEQKNWQGT